MAQFHPSVVRILGDYHDEGEMAHAKEWVDETAATLALALRSYHMKADIQSTRLTPNAALIHFAGNDNISVERIEKKRSYLYTTWGLEISAVRPGKGRISVMVKRDVRHVTQTGRLWRRRQLPDTAPHYNTSFVVGEREDTGEILYLNLSRPFAGQPTSGPHTLIAGESGGGKGVFASNLIMDICATNSPQNARIHLIDPKAGVDYGWLEGMPHLEDGIVTDMDDSSARYSAICAEMEDRYAKLAEKRSRDMDAYNERIDASERLPRIYVVHDELADWMLDDDYRKDTGELIARISAKGRAAGIHLILITQRPDKKAMPGLIKANIANKICLRVSNKVNSNLIIDEAGAEELMGAGHMLAIIGGVPGGAVFAQSSYLDPWDAELMANAIKDDIGAEEIGNAPGDDDSGSADDALPKAA